MTTIAPYQPRVRPGGDGFGRLLRAEWTKFRTVRGWVIAVLIAAALPMAVALLSHNECSVGNAACPASPVGPGGEAVTDSFHFAHQALTGNGTLTVRMTSLTGEYAPDGGFAADGTPVGGFRPGLQPWSKSGIMIKASTKAGSAYAAMLVTGSHGVRMQWNFTGDRAGMAGNVSASSPRWLRLTRSGDTITGYDSPDGTHWTMVDQVTLSGLPRTAQAGLFAASPGHSVTTTSFGASSSTGGPSLATGRFDHVGLPSGASLTGTGIGGGSPGLGSPGGRAGGRNPFQGSFTAAGGAYAVTGSGDIAPDVPEAPEGNGMSVQSALTGMVFALIAVIIVAALFITAEYRRGLIRLTLAASPRRGRVLAAKAIVIGAVTFVAGLVGALVAVRIGEREMRDGGNWLLPISAFTEARMIVGVAAMLAVAAVLALALGTLTRRAVTAVTTVIVVIFLPFLLGTLQGLLPLGAQEWLLRLTPAAGFSVLQQLPAYHQVFADYTPASGYFPLAWWGGFAVVCLWALAALAGAACVLRRRDA